MDSFLRITGARTNNLRDVSLDVPKKLMTVFTGVSGSGKSSLVLDTIAAEAQRLVNDSYSTFIRSRLPQMPAPDVQAMDGLTFTVLIDQRRFTGNARSTVATATDLASLVRLVFSRIGSPSAGYSPAYSFNDPSGMCPTCEGLGTVYDIDLDALIDQEKSIDEGPVRFSLFRPGVYRWKRFAYAGLFDRQKPLKDYTAEEMDLFLYADQLKLTDPDPRFPQSARFDGVVTRMRAVFLKQRPVKMSAQVREELDRLVTHHTCPDCQGARVNAAARASLIDGHSIVDWMRMPVAELRALLDDLADARVAPAIDGIRHVLDALLSVGLGYLTLGRESSTLSGGEAQRVKIVRHLGSALTDVTYVFDEPSTGLGYIPVGRSLDTLSGGEKQRLLLARHLSDPHRDPADRIILDEPTSGLHPNDVDTINRLFDDLLDDGATLVVVEHNMRVVARADHVIDIGPGAGSDGGRLMFAGTPAALAADRDSLTGRALASSSVRAD